MPVSAIARDVASAPFFDAAAEGRLLVRRCGDCGEHAGPEVATCPACGGRSLNWADAAGTGEIVTWTTTYRKDRETGQVVGTTIALVQLAEGPWLHMQCVDITPEELKVGLPVTVRFEQPDEGEAVPVAVPR